MSGTIDKPIIERKIVQADIWRQMIIFATIISLILSFYFLFVGLRVLLTKRPLVLSNRSIFWVVVLAFLPGMIFPISSFVDLYMSASEHSLPFRWAYVLPLLFPLLMYPVLLIFYWRILSGYSVLGITDESFRQALYSVLRDLRIPYEERLSKMHLTELDTDLAASVNGWIGSATIRIKQKNHKDTLDQIALGLRNYFAGSHVATNMVTCRYYLIFGLLMLAGALALAYLYFVMNI